MSRAVLWSTAVALSGWSLAVLGGVLAAALRAALRHELRGPPVAIGLGLELAGREPPGGGGVPGSSSDPAPPAGAPERGLVGSADRLWPGRGLELELARARAALEDLTHGARRGTGRRLERLDVASLLDDAIAAAAPTAAAAGVELVGAWTGVPARVWGDGARLAQALRNLIANAIEHGARAMPSPPGAGNDCDARGTAWGAVRVDGAVVGAMVRIEVTDTGPGLPAPVAELVVRASGGRGRRGRGLAIATSIVEAHGGRLAAAPSGAGARLVIELPAAGGD